jgi:hypothetical protein
LSQDHVETSFSIVRRRGGWNNNPTALEFTYTYRAILGHLGVEPSPNANVRSLDSDEFMQADMMFCSNDDDAETQQIFTDSLSDDISSQQLPALSFFVENFCEYFAGFVVRRLLPKLKCEVCRSLLVALPTQHSGSFLQLRDNGGLDKPSSDVLCVVEMTEKVFRELISTEKPAHDICRFGSKLEKAVVERLDFNKLFPESSHALDTLDGIDNHVFSLVRLSVRFYLDIRKFHVLKNWNIAQAGPNVHQSLTKTVPFKNQ